MAALTTQLTDCKKVDPAHLNSQSLEEFLFLCMSNVLRRPTLARLCSLVTHTWCLKLPGSAVFCMTSGGRHRPTCNVSWLDESRDFMTQDISEGRESSDFALPLLCTRLKSSAAPPPPCEYCSDEWVVTVLPAPTCHMSHGMMSHVGGGTL